MRVVTHLKLYTCCRSQNSSDEEGTSQVSPRRHRRQVESRPDPSILDLTSSLAQACTAVGIGAIRDGVERVQNLDENRLRSIQTVVVVFIVAIAGYILLSIAQSGVHIHHWDFQFPPQPPRL